MRARLGLYTLAFGLSLAACGREDVAAPREPGAPIGDEPTGTALTPGLALSSLLRAAQPAVASGGEFVYVAAVSGTRSDAVRATVANLATGVRVTAAIVEGGFDPVLLPASEGDSIRVALVDGSGGSTPLVASARRPSPPRVVRTSPRGGRTDVPLNSIVQVVFSAPMDPVTIERQLRLERAGAIVSGEVRVLNGGLVAEFAPAAALASGEQYELWIGAAASDVLNQSLGADFRLVFQATAGPDSTVPGSDSSTAQFERLWVHPSRLNVPGWTSGTGAFWQPRALFVGDSLWLAARAAGVQGVVEAVRAQWRSTAASVLGVAEHDDGREALAVAVTAGSVELRASAGGAYGVWHTQVFEPMPTSMLTDVWIHVARDGNVFRERVDGSDARPLIVVSDFQLQRFDWEPYLKYFPGMHDWRRASVSGARTVAANFGGIWIIRSGGDVYAPSSLPDVWCPTWSPDDRRIAFTSQGVPYSEMDALMVVDVDSAMTRRLAWPGGALPNCPIWDPDGTRLIVTSPEYVEGTWPNPPAMVTYAVPLDGSPRVRLFAGPIAGPLAPDGRTMLVVDADGDLHRATTEGVLLQRIAGVARISPVAWSADGALIAMPFYVMSADGRYARNVDGEILGFAP